MQTTMGVERGWWKVARCRAAGFAVAALVACNGSGGTLDAASGTGSTSGVEPSTGPPPGTSTSDGTGPSSGSTSIAEGSTSEPAGSFSGSSSTGAGPAYPEPGDWPPQTGLGGPAVVFEPGDLFQNCAFLDGGPADAGHHNLLVMFDGDPMMPWAPEWGRGGITFFDVSDPCTPVAG